METISTKGFIMMVAAGLVAGVAFGLYAGKRRAHGDSWSRISHDLCDDTIGIAKSAWTKVSAPFRKG